MQKTTYRLSGLFTAAFMSVLQICNAQCIVSSSNGYNVNISVTPVSIIVPADCQWGYNYNVRLNYNVTFSGSNIPGSLYTLQGNIYCDGQANFYSLPTSGGAGSTTTGSNPWRGASDCATATPTSLHCTSVQVVIEGPGISLQTINCNSGGPLPVSLTSFNGRIINNNNVYLEWVTASETNNRYFTVQRSADGLSWQSIKTLPGAINSNTIKKYDHTDDNLAIGTYYYRIQQTDINGNTSYSNIIAANIIKAGTKAIAMINDGTGKLQFTGLGNSSDWELVIFNNLSAAVLFSKTMPSSTVQLPQLNAGVYYARLRNRASGQESVHRFVKI